MWWKSIVGSVVACIFVSASYGGGTMCSSVQIPVVAGDYARSLTELRHLGKYSDLHDQYRIVGQCLFELIGTGNGSQQTVVGWIDDAISSGVSDAALMRALGSMGSGGYPAGNVSEVIRWTNKAMNLGSADAKALLGLLHFWGRGVPEDYLKGIMLLEEAANEGSVYAQVKLAQAYAEGKYLPADKAKSVFWGEKAKDSASRQGWSQ